MQSGEIPWPSKKAGYSWIRANLRSLATKVDMSRSITLRRAPSVTLLRMRQEAIDLFSQSENILKKALRMLV
jgi:hypothetical protein